MMSAQWYARNAIMLNRAQSQRPQSVLCMVAYPWQSQSASYLGMKEEHLQSEKPNT